MDTSKLGSGPEKLQRPRHVVCLPVPAQSHIGAMIKLAKLLHHRGFHVSFVNTEFNHRRMLEARGTGFTDALPARFQFLAILDGLPQSQANATQSMKDVIWAQRHGMVGPFVDLIADLNRKATGVSGEGGFPTVSCIVSDGFMTFTAEAAAEKYDLPYINLWTVSACSMMGFMQYPALIERCLFPPKDENFLTNGYLETRIDWVPGMKDMRLRDFPSFIRTTDKNDFIFNFIKDAAQRGDKAAANIIHTFEALEQDVLDCLSSKLSKPVYAVGPLHLLLNRIPEHQNHLKHIRCNLWKEDAECLDWLNSQKVNSVIYVNFGSITHLTQEQLIEFAMGIAYSEQPFLWIIRPDLVKGAAAIMPPELIEETKGRGLISSWCPQEEVLNHPSIGGFLSHCGWSSVIESLSAGIPMLCWPYFCDQQTNCKYICTEWMAGLEINNVVMRHEVELLIRELMVGEKGKELKLSAMRWKKLAKEGIDSHGSSFMNLDKLFHQILHT